MEIGGLEEFPGLDNQCSRCHWGLVQESGVGGVGGWFEWLLLKELLASI